MWYLMSHRPLRLRSGSLLREEELQGLAPVGRHETGEVGRVRGVGRGVREVARERDGNLDGAEDGKAEDDVPEHSFVIHES